MDYAGASTPTGREPPVASTNAPTKSKESKDGSKKNSVISRFLRLGCAVQFFDDIQLVDHTLFQISQRDELYDDFEWFRGDIHNLKNQYWDLISESS
ncbi:hypothetical protein PRIPAC_95514 [Pristionchus pacificus]|uniref:Uncharacterized protein n=1 Tax=Pristionchus pacificus TaxID=54126 RepID=A0A2A6B2L4_PRIPA|nr:hypothetical protein PRIPAC_95514 [Pristionchus pacificus]|eukprot:PDM60115.1 hypothetical protein PRIPAC_49401 [Pristionchus pacificus]